MILISCKSVKEASVTSTNLQEKIYSQIEETKILKEKLQTTENPISTLEANLAREKKLRRQGRKSLYWNRIVPPKTNMRTRRSDQEARGGKSHRYQKFSLRHKIEEHGNSRGSIIGYNWLASDIGCIRLARGLSASHWGVPFQSRNKFEVNLYQSLHFCAIPHTDGLCSLFNKNSRPLSAPHYRSSSFNSASSLQYPAGRSNQP